MRRPISLGLSCQSRFTIDCVSAEHRRAPFDYNITTKAGLLDALRSDGAVFRLADEAALRVYRAPREGREGIEAGGVFFWHDFDLNPDETLAPGWRSQVEEVRQKNTLIWRRFRKLLAEGDGPVTFVLSNTQLNLGEFASDFDDFTDKFRFTQDFVRDLRSAVESLGVKDARLLLLNRYLRDSIELNHAVDAPWCRSIFCGPLTFSSDALIAASAFTDQPPADQLKAACQRYEDGWRVVEVGEGSAAITRNGELAGELRPMRGGYIAAFDDGHDAIRTAVLDEGALYWSDKTRWRRL